MKTLNVDLDKLSKEGLKAYILLLEELEQGYDLPFPPEYPEQLPRPKQVDFPKDDKFTV